MKESNPNPSLSESVVWKDFAIDSHQNQLEELSTVNGQVQSLQSRPRRKSVIIDVAKFVEGKQSADRWVDSADTLQY